MLKKFRTIVIAVLPAFLINCAATSDQASKESILPEIDVVQVKEKAEEALRVIQQIKLEMPVITTKITDLDNRIIGVSEENQSASPARVEELETQIVLLTEAFKGMQAQVNTLQSRGLGPVVTDTTARMPGDTSKDYIDTGIVRKPGDTGKTVKASVKKAGAVVGPTFSPASASNLL
ncbi:MAG: hypothetical protein MUF22_09335, partial [Chitinispirillaceae bacterium]|nr:hypothetical protein [Chitinispirillaceae bacterium]